MRNLKEESSSSAAPVIDLISDVKELHRLNSQELTKLLKDSENFLLLHVTENGSSLQINMDKLTRFLPLHLTAVLVSSERDEASLRYLLSGLRLLYSLCDIASRHPKLEQVLLDDLRVSEQLLDFVFYLLVCSACGQGQHMSGIVPLLFSALVACGLYLLTACISSQWHELAYVLQAHPKVDIFIDAAFGAVRRNINFLQIKLSAKGKDDFSKQSLADEKSVYFCCQQCEASFQFLQSLCQHKSFRERILKNKELCGKGGVLRLAQVTLKLDISPSLQESHAVVAAVSRIKARVLSILLHLCEVESVSYLDEVASIPESLDLAKSVAVEVIVLLKTMLSRGCKQLSNSGKTYPMGLLQLNALRLADIFSDDSNFRSFITIYFTEVLAAIMSLPYQEFLSSWCSSDLPFKEEDASLDFEPFVAAGWILDLSSQLDATSAENFESNFILSSVNQSSYAHQRTSLLVKVIANLHCFVPKICKEQERNLFLRKFLERMKTEWQDPQTGYVCPSQTIPGVSFSSAPNKAATVCKNLRALLGHAESLIPTFLNEEDVQLLRVFFTQLQSLIGPVEYEVNRAPEFQSAKGCLSSVRGNVDIDSKIQISNLREGMSESSAFPGVACIQGNPLDEADRSRQDSKIFGNRSGRGSSEPLTENEKDVQIAETSGSDSSSTRGKNSVIRVGNGESDKLSPPSSKNVTRCIKEDEKFEYLNCPEKQLKKRKRPIMNDLQMSMIEKALLDEPDMHKNATSLQSWADRLSFHGSEVTSSQLKNWLNNRKARLARAAKDGRPLHEEENAFHDKEDSSTVQHSFDSPLSLPEGSPIPSTGKVWTQCSSLSRTFSGTNTNRKLEAPSPELLANVQNKCSTSSSYDPKLEAGQAVVLTDTQGKEIAKGTVYQVEGAWHGCNLADTKTCVVDINELKSERIVRLPHPSIEAGATFEEAEIKVGNMRVLWDANRVLVRK